MASVRRPANWRHPASMQALQIVGVEQPPQPAALCVSSLRDAKQHIVHETLPWSAFKRYQRCLIICALINGPSDCRSSGKYANTTVSFWITWLIFNKKNKQTLLSPSAKTTWLVTNEWATVLLMDFGSLDILPVWNHTKSRKKRTKSTSTRRWFGPEQTN